MITEGQVYERLKRVMDPELHIDIVSLGLIYKVEVNSLGKEDYRVKVTMTLTTPGCPLAPVIDKLIKDAIESLPGVSRQAIELQLVWEPAWKKEMMSEEAKLQLGMI